MHPGSHGGVHGVHGVLDAVDLQLLLFASVVDHWEVVEVEFEFDGFLFAFIDVVVVL